ncbi:MAG: alpha/beta hydrolase [Pseudomonadales bacterium]|jgi:pimeloyl-ACP methyl ester carboxylesterase|tara:strand:- start:12247 stop:13134 length:888 start_codon:yes stop_codon:yes gene_type:complete
MNEFGRARPTSHSYFSQRLKLHYLDWGNPDSPNVLLVHGVQDHCHSWDWVSDELCSKYHLLVPDLRGHGDSEWNKGAGYSNFDYVYDLAQLLEHEELTNVNIIAHSMGGTIASLLAGTYPEKVNSLISIEGVGGIPHWYRDPRHPQEMVREWIENTRSMSARVPRKYDTQNDALTRMQKSNPHLSEAQAKHLTVHGSNRNEDSTYTWKFDNYTHTRGAFGHSYEDMTQLWERIECPSLFINAKQGYGNRIGQNDTLKHFSDARVIDIDQAGHWLHHDQFEQFMSITHEFLGKHIA